MRQTVQRLASIQQPKELIDRLRIIAQQTRDRVRTHILSRELCDESLNLLKPTLPAPGTCDVIDINPGACVWSEAVHDLLKPRQHILVEKNRKGFAEFLEPLLQQSNSAYRYAPDLPTAISPKSGLLSRTITDNPLEAGRVDGPNKLGATENTSLLVVANLTRSARAPGFSGTEARRFLSNYYRSLFNSTEYIHKYGLVRIIAWVDESSRRAILPTGIAGQTKQSVQLEAAFDMTEIAGPSIYANTHPGVRRWYQLNEENFEDVKHQEAKAGLVLSKLRASPMPPRPLQSHPPSSEFLAENKAMFPENQKYIQDLLSVEARIASDNPEWLHSYSTRFKDGTLSAGHPYDKGIVNRTDDQKLYRRLMNQLQTYHNNFHKLNDIIAQHRFLWQQFKALGIASTAGAAKHETLVQKHEALMAKTQALKHDNQTVVWKAIDDYRAYDCEPRALSWNRRTLEPLHVHADDFYPRHSLSLIDLRPRPSFRDRLNTIDKVVCFDYLVTNLMVYRSDTVPQAIHRLTGVGHDDFLQAMPELQDVAKGGWHKLEDLRLRSLSRQFYVRLAEVFEQWPHRPPTEKLIAMGSSVFDKLL